MKERPLVLIADDDSELLRGLSLRLKSRFDIHTAATVGGAKALAARNDYDAAIIDLCFEGQEQDGVHLIDHLGRHTPGTFLIVLSGDSSVKRVLEATRRKLLQFVYKEDDFFDTLLTTLNQATQLKRAREEQTVRKYLTESPSTLEILQTADRILRSRTDASILVLGETGSGKEFLAQHIAQGMKKRLVAANMGSIPRETAESILFGHERGAFTGALNNKLGLIESANDGIFFLDEIGECSPSVQAKLLRVLQEKEVQPVGSNLTRKVRVQFLAATHQNLNEMVAKGTFRQDLLQRLNTFVLRLPPLRERPEDILLYANVFLDEISEEEVRYPITSDGANALLAHSWPGNIRELRSVIQRIVVLSNRLVLDASTVTEAIEMGSERSPAPSLGRVGTLEVNLRRVELIKALENNHGNKRLAAKTLGVSEATLYRWVESFGLRMMANHLRNGIPNPSEAL